MANTVDNTRRPTRAAVYMLTLGCDKNRVDGEVALGRLLCEGIAPVDDPSRADIIVVNTCGFISEATSESIATILYNR